MSTPAFRLRLPCIPYVPAIEGSLVSSCSVHPLPGPCFIPPVPPPPPPSFGCYELEVEAGTIGQGITFGVGATVSYPNRAETGVCEPVISIQLRLPSGKDRENSRNKGGGSISSSGSGGPIGPPTGSTEFSVLVDIECNVSTCEITKYFKKLAYDNATYIVYWMDPLDSGSS